MAAKARKRKRHRRPVAVARAPRPSRAEQRLLALAEEVTRVPAGGAASPTPLVQTLTRLAAAFAAGSDLPAEMCAAWLRCRGDKTRALALAWAREQLRLGLSEIVAREARAGRCRRDIPAEALSWILLAGAEALAYEPPAAVADRLALLLDFAAAPAPAV